MVTVPRCFVREFMLQGARWKSTLSLLAPLEPPVTSHRVQALLVPTYYLQQLKCMSQPQRRLPPLQTLHMGCKSVL